MTLENLNNQNHAPREFLSEEFRRLTGQEEGILREIEGASFIDLDLDTIEEQGNAGRRFRYRKPSTHILLKARSTITRVGFFRDPEKFFIPGSGGKNLTVQEELTRIDTEELRQRTGLKDIVEIIPKEASVLTGLVFKNYDETGSWLFGKEYAAAQGLGQIFGRTKHLVDKSGSKSAFVGFVDDDGRMDVRNWPVDKGSKPLFVVRVIVARK